jgi:4a-hydroxytetrahydrobiopterin dehydratase
MYKYTIATSEEINEFTTKFSEWSFDNDSLIARFVFKDFKMLFAAMSYIALESETMNHHPTIHYTYNKADILLNTHDAGNKVTNLDIKLATKISTFCKK